MSTLIPQGHLFNSPRAGDCSCLAALGNVETAEPEDYFQRSSKSERMRLISILFCSNAVLMLLLLRNLDLKLESFRPRRHCSAAPISFSNTHHDLLLNMSYWFMKAAGDAAANNVSFNDECSASFGEGFIAKWRSAKSVVCQPNPRGRSSHRKHSSSVVCSANPTGVGLACDVVNLVVDSKVFVGTGLDPYNKTHNARLHAHRFIPIGSPASVKLACELSGARGVLASDVLPWFKNAYSQVTDSKFAASVQQ